MTNDELIKMLEETSAPELEKEHVLKYESKFINEVLPEVLKIKKPQKIRKLAIIATSIAIIFLITVGSFALRNQVGGIGIFLSKFGRYMYIIKYNNAIVASVNGENIYLSDVANEYFTKKAIYDYQEKYYNVSSLNSLQGPIDILNELIDQKLIAQYIKKNGKYKIDEVYLNNLISNEKEWFKYKLHSLPESIKLNSVSYKYFIMESKIIQDLFNHSGLSEKEFFEEYILPRLKDNAFIYSLKEGIKDDITEIPVPTDQEINCFIEGEGKGLVIFAKLSYSSLSEAENAKLSFEKGNFSEYTLLDVILQNTGIAPLTNLTFSNFSELPTWLVEAIEEKRDPPYLKIVKNDDSFYLVGIFNFKKPLNISKELAIFLIKQKKIEEESVKILTSLKNKLRKESKIKITNEEIIKNLENMN